MPAKKRPEERFALRLPKGRLQVLAEKASLNNRSLNSEIVHRLDLTETLESELERCKRTIDELLDKRSS